MSEHAEKIKYFDPVALISFVEETKEGNYGVVFETGPDVYEVEARREDIEEPIFYYSFR